MYRIVRHGSRFNFSFVHPRSIDLAVPTEPQSLKTIMDNYPLPWVRASNANYFIPGTGEGLGAIVERGTTWDFPEPDTVAWPALVVRDNVAAIQEDSRQVKGADLAAGAGPILVRDGRVVDIAAEIRRGGYTGFADGISKPQVGVGLRADGLVVHAVAVSMTLRQFAQCFVEVGCRVAMKLDSGGSATLYQKNAAGGVERLLGYDTRRFPCALVVRQEEPAPEDVRKLFERKEPPLTPQPGPVWKYIVVHHTASSPTATVEEIRRWHVQERGWRDIGYHYLITADGEVKAGRSLNIPGAHADGKAPGETVSLNFNSVGVACINNFEENYPPDAQIAALIRFVRQLMRQYGIQPSQILLHREQVGGTPTSCPGRRFLEQTFKAAISD